MLLSEGEKERAVNKSVILRIENKANFGAKVMGENLEM